MSGRKVAGNTILPEGMLSNLYFKRSYSLQLFELQNFQNFLPSSSIIFIFEFWVIK